MDALNSFRQWAGRAGARMSGSESDYVKARETENLMQKKREAMDVLEVRDILKTGDVNGAKSLLQNRMQQYIQKGARPERLGKLSQKLNTVTPGDIPQVMQDFQDFEQRAVQAGLIDAAPQAEAGFSNPVTGSDGIRYGIPKGSPNQGYVPIPSPEGVKFDAGGQEINVNTGSQPRGSFFGTAVDNATESLTTFRDSATAAQSRLPAIRTLKNIDIESGFGTNARLGLARATNAVFGDGAGDVFMGDVPAAEAFNALSQKMVNEELNLAKGPQTEGDAQRARSTVASLDKAPAANKFLLNYYEGLSMREMERNRFFEDRMSIQPGQTDEAGLQAFREAERTWAEYKNRTPLVAQTRSDGTVVSSDPNTAIPMTYYEFEKRFMRKNADRLKDMTMKEKREAAQQSWRRVNEIE